MQTFENRVEQEINLLNNGKPLEAFNECYSDNVLMYDNDSLFAQNKTEGFSKQEPFISAALEIHGKITDLIVDAINQTVVFRNRTSFIAQDNNRVQIDGLCRQVWKDGWVVEERYYSGESLPEQIRIFYS